MNDHLEGNISHRARMRDLSFKKKKKNYLKWLLCSNLKATVFRMHIDIVSQAKCFHVRH